VQNRCDAMALLAIQRGLRDRILGRRSPVSPHYARELAAQMLLYLDDPIACLKIGAHGMLDVIAADRINAGFSTPQAAIYSPLVKALRVGICVSKVREVIVDARDGAVSAVWASRHPVVFDDIARDVRFGSKLRAQLLAVGTRRKLAVALRDGDRPIGLLCADRIVHEGFWRTQECTELETIVCHVIAPIVAASRRLCSTANCGTVPLHVDQGVLRLSPAEFKVAELVVSGYSYKEIARCLDRAISTVDHQLRSIRDKLGVNSTAKLIRVLNASLQLAYDASSPRHKSAARGDNLRVLQFGQSDARAPIGALPPIT
jgi:DNA-binding CsgD family transcriptional regulator